MNTPVTGESRPGATALVISGGGWPGAYDIVRALGREGIPSAAALSRTDDLAFSSRYVTAKIPLPPFQPSRYDEILQILVQFGSQCSERPVLFYVGDSELEFVSCFKDQLRSVFRFLLPEDDILRGVCNKGLFFDLAIQYQLPIPPTQRFENVDELHGAIDTINFPCIVKPVHNRDWFWSSAEEQKLGTYKEALRRIETKEDLRSFCAALPSRSTSLVVQTYIDGTEEDVVAFNGYFDETSSCLGYTTGREIRTNPPVNGESAYSEITADEELARRSIGFLQRMNFRGIVKIDYKWDASNGQFFMIEIEPHYQFWHLLGSYAGVHLALIAYRHQRGETAPPPSHVRAGERMLYFKYDVIAYLRSYRKKKRWPFHTYLGTLLRKQHYRVLDPNDPWPFVKSALGFGINIIKGIVSKRVS